jgi:hypothetical protein
VPPALSANDMLGGRTPILNIRRTKQIDRQPAESDDDNSPESMSDTESWLTWNGDLDNRNESEDNWEADNESDMELDHGSKDSETSEQQNVRAALNVPRVIQPIRWTKKKVEKALMTVNMMETSTNTEIKKKSHKMRQCIITNFVM